MYVWADHLLEHVGSSSDENFPSVILLKEDQKMTIDTGGFK
jgi:hypothetical protein